MRFRSIFQVRSKGVLRRHPRLTHRYSKSFLGILTRPAQQSVRVMTRMNHHNARGSEETMPSLPPVVPAGFASSLTFVLRLRPYLQQPPTPFPGP